MDAGTIVSLVIGSLGLLVAITVAAVQYKQNKSLSERMIRIEEARRLDEIRREKGAEVAAQIIFDQQEGTDWLEITNKGPGGAKNILVEPVDPQFAGPEGLRPIPILEPGGKHTFRFSVYEHPSRATDLRISHEDATGSRQEVVTTGFLRTNPFPERRFLDRFRRQPR